MIKSLTYSVTFPTNGLSLSGAFSFQPGLTAVTGDNGSGKSFGTIEMARYMFFGKKALRGPASDYKTLTGKMVVEIKGRDYTISRTPKGESIKDDEGEVLAVGAEAVTMRCQTLLGMTLDVFDIVCAAVQKESDRLSKLTPTTRKQLIDRTVGLTANEAVEKACKEEANGLLREAEALRSVLVVPVEPVLPLDYLPSAELEAELRALKAVMEQRRQLELITASVGLPPEAPEQAVPDIAELQVHEDRRLTLQADVTAAERQLKALPEVTHTTEDLDHAEAVIAYRAEVLRRGAKPQLSMEEIKAWESYYEQAAVVDRLQDLEVTCPSCATSFCPGHVDLEPPEGTPPSGKTLREARQAHDHWSTPLEEVLPQGAYLSPAEVATARFALTKQEERKALLATTWLPVPADRSSELKEAIKLQLAWDSHATALAAWEQRQGLAEQAAADLAALPVVTEAEVEAKQALYVAARVYEGHHESWLAARAVYQTALADIEDRVRRADDFKLGAKRLAETRRRFKGHLAPTLSRIASSLIYEMTGGVLSSVIVDEDMNIAVDGQDIATLSGAGSTVANLALRIALGQVLVRGVLPIFIADEADSDMAESRAEYTMECLSNLSEKLKQIVVITHKSVKFTDQVISLPSNKQMAA